MPSIRYSRSIAGRMGRLMQVLWLGIAMGATLAGHAVAQTYPNKPIRVIVPYAPGSGTDLITRQVLPHVSQSLGQPMVIENIIGAVGIIGTEAMLRAPNDGYTLVVTSPIHAVLPSLYKLSFDPINSFSYVSTLGTSPMVLVVNPKVPAQTTQELLALAKAKPGELTIGSTGIGSIGHIAAEMLQTKGGVKFLHVPYKGNSGFTADLLGGQIDAGFLAGAAAAPLVRSGRLRAIAVSTTSRSAALPAVPTLNESGVPGYEVGFWAVMIAPAGTPPTIVARLNEEIQRTTSQKAVQDYFKEQTLEPDKSSPEATKEMVKKDIEAYAKVVKDAAIKPE